MNNTECIATFINFHDATRKLVIVTKESSVDQYNGSSLIKGFIGALQDPATWDSASWWICAAYDDPYFGRYCTLEWALSFEHDWKIQWTNDPAYYNVSNVTVDHCLVGEPANVDTGCGFHYNAYLFLAVCICTTAAASLVALVTFKHSDPTIVVVGDAVESFLKSPEDLLPWSSQSTLRRRERSIALLEVRAWEVHDGGPRWFWAVGKKTWLLSITL